MSDLEFYQSCDIADFAEGCLFDGRYLIREKLGEGGFAVTWRCLDMDTDLDVALKLFKSHVDVEMVRNEFKASFKIHHERCARVLDMKVGPNYGNGFMVLTKHILCDKSFLMVMVMMCICMCIVMCCFV